jgi:hypothetical protein
MNGLASIAMAAAQLERIHSILPSASDHLKKSTGYSNLTTNIPMPSRPNLFGPRVVSDEPSASPIDEVEIEGLSLADAHLEVLLQETLLMAEAQPAAPPAPSPNQTFANVQEDDVLCGRGGETNQ